MLVHTEKNLVENVDTLNSENMIENYIVIIEIVSYMPENVKFWWKIAIYFSFHVGTLNSENIVKIRSSSYARKYQILPEKGSFLQLNCYFFFIFLCKPN